MSGHPIGRVVTVCVSAALLASLVVVTTSGAATAKPKCGGKVATIVGTAKSERIVGTNGPDVIVARGGNDFVRGRGGNDIICGGPGNDFLKGGPGVDRLAGNAGDDRLLGNGGPDRLFGEQGRDHLFGGLGNDRVVGGIGRDFLSGGIGNDTLAGGAGFDWLEGGPGTDRCLQNSGAGPKEFCELPTWMIGPEPPTLVIAYSDLDGDHAFGAEDVMISKIVDNDRNGRVSRSDSIIVGRYPTTLTPTTTADFGEWGVKIRRSTSSIAGSASTTCMRWTPSEGRISGVPAVGQGMRPTTTSTPARSVGATSGTSPGPTRTTNSTWTLARRAARRTRSA